MGAASRRDGFRGTEQDHIISEVLKHGLGAYELKAQKQVDRKPYDIYRKLDSGVGGDAIAPARDAKSAVADAMRKKQP